MSVYASGQRHAAHRHDEMQLSLVLNGQVRETVGSSTQTAGALSVVVKDSGVVHANEFGRDKPRIARLSLHSGVLTDLVDHPSRAESWKWTHDPRVAFPFLKLVARAAANRSTSFPSDDPDIVDVLAAFTSHLIEAPRGSPPRWLDEVMSEIRFAWKPGVTVREIARRARVHPVYLARCVRRWYGTGIAEELRRARVRAAAQSLGQAGETVSRIAHRHGYSDESHLCRDLRGSLGLTPGGYRKLIASLS